MNKEILTLARFSLLTTGTEILSLESPSSGDTYLYAGNFSMFTYEYGVPVEKEKDVECVMDIERGLHQFLGETSLQASRKLLTDPKGVLGEAIGLHEDFDKDLMKQNIDSFSRELYRRYLLAMQVLKRIVVTEREIQLSKASPDDEVAFKEIEGAEVEVTAVIKTVKGSPKVVFYLNSPSRLASRLLTAIGCPPVYPDQLN